MQVWRLNQEDPVAAKRWIKERKRFAFSSVPNFDTVASIQSLQPPSASTSAPFAQSVPPTALPTTAPVSRSSHAAPLPPAHRKKPSQAQAISTPTLPLILVASTPTPQAAKPSIMTPSPQTPKSPKGKAAPKPKPPTRRKPSTKANKWQNANACTHSRDIIWLCQSALDLPPSTSPIPISKDYWKYLLPTKYRDSMARLIRSARSGSDWGRNELLAYNITVAPIPPQDFFREEADPPLTGLDPALINSPLGLDDSHLSDDTYRFLGYLDLATNTSQETAIVDFARELLRVVGFEERGRILRTRHTIPLSICGENNTVAQTDVCLMDRRSTILLVLQDDKTIFNPSNPEPQVIAEAIAAYQHNNQRRNRMGLPTLNTMTVPCITMVGTRPTFYLVPVTRELSDAVITGQWPEVETKVMMCVTVAGRHRRLSEGMEVPEYRRVAFQRMLAFKAIAKSHWEKFLID